MNKAKVDVIEKHIEVSKVLKKLCVQTCVTGTDKARSDLDDLFMMNISAEEWAEYREINKIEGMHISPYYGKGEKDE